MPTDPSEAGNNEQSALPGGVGRIVSFFSSFSSSFSSKLLAAHDEPGAAHRPPIRDQHPGDLLWLEIKEQWSGRALLPEVQPGGSPFLWRYASHVALALLIVAAMTVGRINVSARKGLSSPLAQGGASPAVSAAPNPGELLFSKGFLTQGAVPHTIVPERSRQEIVVYTVQSGDSVSSIAQKFDISSETIMWSNEGLEDHPDMLRLGQELVILPVSGVYHTVRAGETVEDIAAEYEVEPPAITGYALNGLEEPYELRAGQKLVVPGGSKPFVYQQVYASWEGAPPTGAERGSGNFGWPASGLLTQGYWSGHPAIDIGAPKGSPVYAADSGFVVTTGFSSWGYGRMIVIDHQNGFQTLYAHLAASYVEPGQPVVKGQQIGTVGTSGNATGPHLHLEIHLNGVPRNPLGFLP